MTLRVHRAERADALVRGLARLLADAPSDPFVPEIVSVPSKGVERWIAQSLSTTLGTRDGASDGADSAASEAASDGICANVLFPSPGRLVNEVVATLSGMAPEDDPWTEHRLAWTVLDVIDGCAGEDWCRTLGRHLGLSGAGIAQHGRRVATAQKLAALFTAYGAQRPVMVREWAAGIDTDGFGTPLADDLAWQAELWRRVRSATGIASPAERVDAACARLRGDAGLVDLPERLSLFGPTRLTTDQIQVLDALAERRDVHLWLPHPSDALWRKVVVHASAVETRRDDPTAELPEHPLVGSCARDVREMQVRLGALTRPGEDTHLPSSAQLSTLLETVQRDIREDHAPRADHQLVEGDRSIQVHACHGRQRQVEVLREVLLDLFESDPTLEQRDVIVMCPDIESYAPLINATFGLAVDQDPSAGSGATPSTGSGHLVHPGHRLRVRLADRSLRQTNPVLTVVARVLELADARLTVSEVLDLAAMPAVRARFGLDDEELERIGDWVRRSGVRWGLDAQARAPYALAGVPQNTWQTGLDRVLLGTAMDEDGLRTLGLALPLDDVDSGEVDLAGRLAELVDRLSVAVEALTTEQPLTAWVDALVAVVDDLTHVRPADDWQMSEARQQLTAVLADAGSRAGIVLLGLPDVRALLAHRLRGRPTRANFRTGQLTMCTMVPMRSVPHRVVCLLGVDDGVFPRGTHADGDDILGRAPRVGERDPRSEDRQLFLDAIMAAKERLVVLYTGADERTGAERPPAVPLGELLDVLDRTVASALRQAQDTAGSTGGAGPAPEKSARDRILVRHPLQPFDARNFVADELGVGGAFSFDRASYHGSKALLSDRSRPGKFLAEVLPDPPAQAYGAGSDVVEVDELVRFLEHPVKGLLRGRLGLSTTDDDEETADAIPVEISHLEQWAIGDRLLTAGLAGATREQAVRAEWLRGDLPPGPLGEAVLKPIADSVEALVSKTAALRSGVSDSLDVAVDLDSGTRVSGTVPGVYGDRIVRVVYSKLGAKHRLRAWVYLLAVVTAYPDRDWSAATVGRGRSQPTMSALVAPPQAEARRLLDQLVQLYRAGLCEPLPLSPKTSAAYAQKRSVNSPVKASQIKAAQDWRRNYDGRMIGDFDDAEHRRVWGDVELAVLLEAPARAGLPWVEEETWFGQLARTVWHPLLTAESTVD